MSGGTLGEFVQGESDMMVKTRESKVPDQSTARPGVRFGCVALLVLPWLVVLLLAAEVWVRLGPGDAEYQAVQTRVDAVRAEDLRIFEATSGDAMRPPAQVNTAYPNPSAIEETPLSEWDVLASRWNALLLACDEAGRILERFVPVQPPALVTLGNRAALGTSLLSLVGEHNEADARGAIAQSLTQRNVVDTGYLTPFDLYSRGFMVDTEPGVPFFYKFHFHGMPVKQGAPALAVAVVPSRFSHGFYRPYAYQDDLYPAYIKSEFWTNGMGFRDAEVVQPKPAGTYRILCVGGSTTGEGPRNDLTYPHFLEQLLNDRFEAPPIDVINVGIDGINMGSTVQQMAGLNELDPDLYIHYNYPNDVSMVMETALKEGPLSSPLHEAVSRAAYGSHFLARHARGLVGWAVPSKSDYRRVVEEVLLPQMRQIHASAESAGAGLAICSVAYPRIAGRSAAEAAFIRGRFVIPLPMKLQLEDLYLAVDAFNEAMQEYCAEEGILYIPTAEEIDGGAELFPDLCHLYIPGLKQKAEIVANAIAPLVGGSEKR
jgi:hypothetical protein